ncbi:MAG: YicC/YloC family endoribonuclease [Planctomycetaceae bacterium]
MLLSMTGFGDARCQSGSTLCQVELKSVNNRHFKLVLRCPDGLARFEPDLERLLRESISRGTVQLTIRLDRPSVASAPLINQAVLKGYWQQLRDCCQDLGTSSPELTSLLGLPGVIDDGELSEEQAKGLWSSLETGTMEALKKLQDFRRREGEAMVADLRSHCTAITSRLSGLAENGPQLIADYRDRLLTRVKELLKSTDLQLNPSDVLREVSLFADRCDISEEVTRLRSHLDQFESLFQIAGSQGRKLEFLCQEMFREANTIGSKSNDVGVAHAAVEIKTSIERMREVVANVE